MTRYVQRVAVADTLRFWLEDAGKRTRALLDDLEDAQLLGPKLPIVNPLRWELGHVGWFLERWALRTALGRPPLRDDGDALYDSSAVPHRVRWDLPLPTRAETEAYVDEVRARVLEAVDRELTPELTYFVQLAVFHEDMHGEAFAMTRQTLGWPAPRLGDLKHTRPGGPLRGDVAVAGGRFLLGAPGNRFRFVFDNEKWAHEVEVAPFELARAPVTQAEFAAFVEDGGYRRPELWTDAGWRWRTEVGSEHPIAWRREGAAWLRRAFDRWVPLEPHLPVHHVCAHEAEAWCRWAGRRLPTEAEWELAAGGAEPRKSTYPWGDSDAVLRANTDGIQGGCVEVDRWEGGDAPSGARQLFGNVWEWTASTFEPYPGFEVDPYADYSRPWFGDHRVLRGGSWVTRLRLLRTTWRNFYKPERRDVIAGFRTCAV
jgi:iron(II)-dependent oxidoreductase